MIISDIWIFTAVASFTGWKLYFWYYPSPESKVPAPIHSQHLLAMDCSTMSDTDLPDDNSSGSDKVSSENPPGFDIMLTTMMSSLGDIMAAKQSGGTGQMNPPFQQMMGMFIPPDGNFPLGGNRPKRSRARKRRSSHKLNDKTTSELSISVLPDDETPTVGTDSESEDGDDEDIMAAMESARKEKSIEGERLSDDELQSDSIKSTSELDPDVKDTPHDEKAHNE